MSFFLHTIAKREFEYKSKWKIGSLPLVHIHFHYSLGLRYDVRLLHKKCRIVGVIANGTNVFQDTHRFG